MAIKALFPTLLYHGPLGAHGAGFRRTLLDECQALAASDTAGQRWSAKHYLGGYTSYGSLDRLHQVSSVFAGLARRLDWHARAFARRLPYDLGGRRVTMTDCWLNVMPAGVVHSLHLHPTSFISGTYYVQVPRGAGALKVEDPRLSRMMAAPPGRPFVNLPARTGEVILFESWLRHEVPPARYAGDRISISFNYAWSAR
jgi:uncharacterized protein (TIGR02466 family)